MIELIELLNKTSAMRVLFYSIVFIVALNIVFYYTMNALYRIFKKK